VTVLVMLIIGIAAGLALDRLTARLAREPYERGDVEQDDLRLKKDGGLELNSETGALSMPTLLTSRSLIRTLVVVAATAAIFAAIGRQYEHAGVWEMLIVALYAAVLIICTGTDVLAYRVPNAVTYPAIAGAVVIGMLMPGANRLDVLAGGLVFGGLLFVPSVLTGGAMGMGDVKLAGVMGLCLGRAVAPAVLVALLAGVLVGGVIVARFGARAGRKTAVPFGPFLAFGAVVGLFAGDALVDWYRDTYL